MQHGGDLSEAAKRFGRARSDWLDLSTGIGPLPYPYEPPTAEAWRKLPQADALDALLTAARLAYKAESDAPIIAAPGTQSLIQMLPLACPSARVAIVGPTYSEHSSSWRRMGSEVLDLVDIDCPRDVKVVLVVSPNNPDGRSWSPDKIMDCAEAMAARGGFLIVDEAFADVAPEISAAPQAGAGGLIVLRSFGKFFGLCRNSPRLRAWSSMRD